MTETKTLAFSLPTKTEWEIIKFQSETLFDSGLLPKHIRTPQQAVAIVLKGRELDVPPWTALTKIHVIEGVPTVAPELMLALIKRSGLSEDIKIDSPEDIKRNNACTVTMKRVGETAHTTTFSMADAERQGLTGKYNWKKMPHVMLKWRAISDCARTVFPDVVSGLYTPEEINPDLTVSDDGTVIDSPAVDAQPDPPSRPASTVTQAQPDAVEGEVVEEPEPKASPKQPPQTVPPPWSERKRTKADEALELPDGEKRMCDLDGRELGMMDHNGPKVVGVHSKHWKNRMANYWPDARGDYRKVGTITVAEFMDMMREPSTEQGEEDEPLFPDAA